MYKTKNGMYYLPIFAYKDMIRNAILNDEVFQPEVLSIAKQYVKENSIVLDLGANYGQLSIEFSKLQKNVTVYSFEAQEYIFRLLKKNIEINNCSAIPHYNLVGNETKTVKAKINTLETFATWGANTITVDKNAKDFNYIEAIKIDDLNINEKISFMKIDIQGKDLDALKGAKQTILKNKMPILFEYEVMFENVYGYNFNDFEDFINEINYKIHLKSNTDYLILPID